MTRTRTVFRLSAAGLLAVAGGLAVGTVQAATVTSCSGGLSGPGARTFTLTLQGDAAATCWDWDVGNIPTQTHGPNQNIFNISDGTPIRWDRVLQLPAGFSLLDDSSQGGDPAEGTLSGSGNLRSGRSGSFSIAGNPGWQYLIAFKTGVAARNPDWMAFLLPQGVTTGEWSISGQQSLSHVRLWGGVVDERIVPQVPIPAAGWLLGSGLMGLLAFARRRRPA